MNIFISLYSSLVTYVLPIFVLSFHYSPPPPSDDPVFFSLILSLASSGGAASCRLSSCTPLSSTHATFSNHLARSPT